MLRQPQIIIIQISDMPTTSQPDPRVPRSWQPKILSMLLLDYRAKEIAQPPHILAAIIDHNDLVIREGLSPDAGQRPRQKPGSVICWYDHTHAGIRQVSPSK